MAIRSKLSLAFCVGALFLMGVGIGVVVLIGHLNEVLGNISFYNFQMEQIAAAQTAINRSPSSLAEHQARLADLKKYARTNKEHALVKQARDELTRDPTLAATYAKLDELGAYYRESTIATHNELLLLHQRAIIATYSVMVGSILLLLVLRYCVHHWLLNPLQAIEQTVTQIESGTGYQPLVLARDGELATLADGLNRIATTIKEVNERIAKAERLAAIGEAATHVANTLRIPLQSIRTLAEYEGGATSVSPDARAAFKHIVALSQKLERWTRDMITTVRPIEPKLAPHALEPLVHEALSLVKPNLLDAEIQLDFQAAENLPPVLVDRMYIEQVFAAILTNAIDALPDRGQLHIALSAGDNGSVQLLVEDNGDGMSENIRNQAFNPFFTTKRDGAGLGLTLAQRIVQLHGGKIELQSESKKGTRVTIQLPVADANGH